MTLEDIDTNLTPNQAKLAEAVLKENSPACKIACDLVNEYDNRMKKIRDAVVSNNKEYEALKLSNVELRSKYYRAINSNKKLQEEIRRLKKEMAQSNRNDANEK